MNKTIIKIENSQNVSNRQQTFIGITKSGGDLLGVLFNGALLTFYVDILHMDPDLFGIVMIIFAVWNAINDPIFGYFSDKRSMNDRGKRSYFIRLSAPIFFFGFLMFWFATPTFSQVGFFIFLLIALFIFDTGLTIFGLNISAIQISQTTSTNERTRIAVIASVISFLPVGIAAILPNMVLTSEMAIIYMRLIFIGMGVLALFLMMFGSFKLKEISLEKKGMEPLAVWSAIKETLKMRSFVTFVIVNFMFTAVSFNLVAVMPLYFKYILQIGDWTVLWVSLPIGVLQVPLYFLYGKIQKKIGLKYSVFLIIGIMLGGFIGLFFSQDIYSTAICYGLCLWMTTFYFVIVNPLVGDVADEDELKTGRRREGMFFGINALITKPASSIIVLFFTLIIDHYGYNSELAVQTLDAQFGIRLGLCILSIAFLVAAIIPLIFYPLNGQKIAQIKESLQIKHKSENELSDEIIIKKEEEIS